MEIIATGWGKQLYRLPNINRQLPVLGLMGAAQVTMLLRSKNFAMIGDEIAREMI